MYDTIINVALLKELMEDETQQVVVVDCRFRLNDPEAGRKMYAEGHIPHAHYAHLDDDLSGPIIPGVSGRHPLPKVEVLSQKLGAWGIGDQKQVIVYDDMGGAIASRLWWMLRWLGHDSVAVLDGGYKAWVEGDLEISQDDPVLVRDTIFYARERREMLVNVEEVVAISSGIRKGLLIDARSQPRYKGEVEPIDPVAGHIPGAVNMPHFSHLNEGGYWKEPETIAKNFMALEGMELEKEMVCYCGSGVTACFNVLALKRAGIRDAKIYPGSWSHWITDSKRKIEK
jgi:thiosulfate/3-mercaptopyruvate sulfurtransferase